ncbi:MAG: alpha/beta hydrolase [Bifidobacteriaceae bacterium]|jgi:acetyl esterase/lipase|nr:alpha/beta hydrolase [Bifidobacteriaceae bacterium]
MTDPRFPFRVDPETVPALEQVSQGVRAMTEEDLRNPQPGLPETPHEQVIDGRAIEWEDITIPGPGGAIGLTVIRPAELAGPVPGFCNAHGGGMVTGTKEMDNARLVEIVSELGVVAVNVEYRLAPRHPYPAGIDDIYAAFEWTAAHAAVLGIDPGRIVVMGGSAGGGFAAAVALRARDRRGPEIAGQLLLCPMLDNTSSTLSALQYGEPALAAWALENNQLAWRMVLGDALAASTDAPADAAPARAVDLSGLPPAFIEVGSAEMFRDEDVDYARRIWAAGGEAELHVWGGGFHGFDFFAPGSRIARAAIQARLTWLRRLLGL